MSHDATRRQEAQMIKKEDFAVIKAMKKQGAYIKDIAEELGVHPKTVSRALKRGNAPRPERKKRGSKLEPYKPKIDKLLSENVWNAMVILREIQADGYDGEITLIRRYIKPRRTMRSGRATVRFETKPGEQLQTDWGELNVMVAGQMTKVYFIVNLLGYSRRFHFWCTDSLDAEHTYEGLIRSFEYFGGVTEEVLVDNQKCAVLERYQGKPIFNPRFLDLADHYGFTARACRPYRARTKGKDERMVGYVKGNFFVRYREFESWAHMNQQAEVWLLIEADQRIQGTVKEMVYKRFNREKPSLKPLPQKRYDTSYHDIRVVGWDSYIDVLGNRYSVPDSYAGEALEIRIGLDGILRVYNPIMVGLGDALVATHTLRSANEGWGTVPEHHSQLWKDALQVEQRPLQTYEEASQWT